MIIEDLKSYYKEAKFPEIKYNWTLDIVTATNEKCPIYQ